MSDALVLVTQSGAVQTLALNRPAALNSFTAALHAQLLAALESAALATDVRCVVITGTGRAFCAGQDLSEAVAASIEGGFPSDINARGDIMLLLLTLENKDVVTVFTRDGKAELCFIQRISSGEIMPLTKE